MEKSETVKPQGEYEESAAEKRKRAMLIGLSALIAAGGITLGSHVAKVDAKNEAPKENPLKTEFVGEDSAKGEDLESKEMSAEEEKWRESLKEAERLASRLNAHYYEEGSVVIAEVGDKTITMWDDDNNGRADRIVVNGPMGMKNIDRAMTFEAAIERFGK